MPVFNWENEKAEAQIERDKFLSQALENKHKLDAKRDDEIYQAFQYNPSATPLSEIVFQMMQSNKLCKMCFKHQVNLDMDIYEAVEKSCIKLGFSSDNFAPYLHDQGMEVEIYLVR